MRRISIALLITILVLIVSPKTNSFFPLFHNKSGNFRIVASGSYSISTECDSGRIATVQYSAEHAALEFFLIHSDFYNLSGLPVVAQCQYHIVSQSATYQFTVGRSGTWYLVFANSPQDQDVTYSWADSSLEEWNTTQFTNWTIIFIGLFVVSIIIIRYVPRLRTGRSAARREKSGAEGVI